ncbi:MAG: hypothetical protein L6R42_006020 [Xanthoria sp. 1 TBL-2021]|nr:MAG: hypothetical protein L6R42_006020 [Xanthoria sp. 1 TBL-2021]
MAEQPGKATMKGPSSLSRSSWSLPLPLPLSSRSSPADGRRPPKGSFSGFSPPLLLCYCKYQLHYHSRCAFSSSQAVLTACNQHSTSTFHFIDVILTKECLRVQQVYLIFSVIFISLSYLADALLLATAFTYLIPRSILTRQSIQSLRKQGPVLLHILFCGLLGLFWLVIPILYLAVIIQQVIQTGIVGNFELVNGVRKLDFTYNLFHFFAALELVALAVMRRPKTPSGSIEPTDDRKLAIAGYDFRDIFFVGIEEEALRLLHMLFYYLCTTLFYFGLALIIRHPGAETFFVDNVHEAEEEDGKAGLGPEIPIMQVAAPAKDVQAFDPHAPSRNSRLSRLSRDHSQDPIYNGP